MIAKNGRKMMPKTVIDKQQLPDSLYHMLICQMLCQMMLNDRFMMFQSTDDIRMRCMI